MVEQIKCYCGHTTYCDCGPTEEPNPFELQKTLPDDVFYESLKPKQKTLEEAAENYAKDIGNKDGTAQWDFKKGAKWAQERMYSEEEVIKILLKHQSDYRSFVRKTSPLNWSFDIIKWFEQFKKK